MTTQQPGAQSSPLGDLMDLVVIGAGPAGLSAAFTAVRQGLSTMLIGQHLGGRVGLTQRQAHHDRLDKPHLAELALLELITSAVLNQARVLEHQVKHIKSCDHEFLITMQDATFIRSRALVIATGAVPLGLHRLGVFPPTLPGIHYPGLVDFRMADGDRVAVVGSTVEAIIAASALALHATRVYIIIDTTHHVPPQILELLRAQPHVMFYEGYEVVRVIGAEYVEAVVVEHSSETSCLHVDDIFVERGVLPQSGLVLGLLETDPEGFILIDGYHSTTYPGIFAAGDVTARPRGHVLAAIGAGERAAVSAYDYVIGQRLAERAHRDTTIEGQV